jgi:oligoribonuclease NrnB/cAMP/cGMP phosphodiesterase (DHH superfamily)
MMDLNRARLLLPPAQVTMVIYHGDCNDGFGSAVALHTLIGDNALYIPAKHGDAPPDVTGHRVVICDFCYDRATSIFMRQQAESLIVLDHHITAKKEVEGLEFAFFDMERSGARLAWEYAHPGSEVPPLIRYIEDRDLWRFALPQSREFSAGLMQIPHEFERYEELLHSEEAFRRCTEIGAILLKRDEEQVAKVAERAHYHHLRTGGTLALINTDSLISEVGADLAQRDGVRLSAMWYYDHRNLCFQVSLRSTASGADASLISKSLGGGGHRAAAGYRWSKCDDIAAFVEALVVATEEVEGCI